MQMRHLVPIFVILVGGVGCDPVALVLPTSAHREVDAHQILSVRNEAGFVVVPPGAFAAGTRIAITSINRPDSRVTRGLLSRVVQLDAGGAQPEKRVRLSLRIDPSAVPSGTKPVLGRWNGQRWVALPTDLWGGGLMVSGDVDHFSWFAVLEDRAIGMPSP